MNNISENNILKNKKINKKIIKGMKAYLTAKKLLKNDQEKSITFFKKSLEYLNDFKSYNKSSKYNDVIKNTENECNKIILDTINNNKLKISKIITNEKIFKIITKGQIDRLKNIKVINLNQYNHNGLTPLHYSIKMGDINILKLLLKKGGCIDIINKNGNTLLEYACLEKDPNFIQQMINHGANMKKHLYFREGIHKYYLKKNGIDLAIIIKIILNNVKENTNTSELNFIFNYIKKGEKIGINDFDLNFLINGLMNLINSIDVEKKNTYIKIIKEEISFPLKERITCPETKIDHLLINLIPFINYPFYLSTEFIVINELKILILKIFKKNIYKINNKIRKEIINNIWLRYITPKLFTQDFIGILTHRIIRKII
jgi:ankyrin repeat protein